MFKQPSGKGDNSVYNCVACNADVSCSNISRHNLKKNVRVNLVFTFISSYISIICGIQAMHLFSLQSFESTHERKRKRDESTNSTTQPISIEVSLAKRPKLYSSEEFDGYVLKYITNSLLPLRHVEHEAFRTFAGHLSPG